MPELPEVETVMRGLALRLHNRRIAKIVLRRADLRFPMPASLTRKTKNMQIVKLERISKYIVMHLESGDRLLWHLGMSGRFYFHDTENYTPSTHDHVVMHLENGELVIYNDARRFGMLDYWPEKQETHRLLANTGIDPFSDTLTPQWLMTRLQKSKVSMKAVLMDQRIIAGLGNIYVSEALFRARIHPERIASSMTLAEAQKLVPEIRAVLIEAIDAGGSTLRDYAQVNGELGYFQNRFRVYGREGEPCLNCKTPIERITQQGRSTFFCPNCQKKA